ncbi:MAG TPA: hypothetical protein VF492_12765 [Verrucomicrobiae bacterium]
MMLEKPEHDYGHTMMALAETLTALGEKENALRYWQHITQNHSYPRAKVQGMVAVGKDPAKGSLGWTILDCAGRAGAATALSGGREISVMRELSVRAKAGSRCACPRSPRHAGALADDHRTARSVLEQRWCRWMRRMTWLC